MKDPLEYAYKLLSTLNLVQLVDNPQTVVPVMVSPDRVVVSVELST